MPADMSVVPARNGSMRSGGQNDVAVLSICLIVALAGVMLALVSDEAFGTLVLIGLY